MSNFPLLELFYFDSCPFCIRVLKVIDKLKIKVELKNIDTDESSLERLNKDTGKKTVPCLYIDNKPMFESLDIIEYLEANQNHLVKRDSK